MPIIETVMTKIHYVGPALRGVDIALDVTKIIQESTPSGAVKTIKKQILLECTPPELILGGKCLMMISGIAASIGSGGNPIILLGTLSAIWSVIKN